MKKALIFIVFVILLIPLTACTDAINEWLEEDAYETQTSETKEIYPFSGFPFAFTAQDLYGNTVTQESLGEKQLFFVHYWATWCGPCVQEMPELAQMAKEYGDRVGFIALVSDYDSNLSGALNITESAGIPISFIMVDEKTKGLEPLLKMVSTGYVPTTAIIDGNGNLVESDQVDTLLIGAYGETYGLVIDVILYPNGMVKE